MRYGSFRHFFYENTFILFMSLVFPPNVYAWTALSVFGKKHYSEKSNSLEYANPQAPKGGSIRIGVEKNFETLNPYSLRSSKALLLNYVIQTLGQRTLDETDTMYPQVAEDFILSKDRMSMRVKLFKDAKFSDEQPITSEDVEFSFNILRSKYANPFYKNYWNHVKGLQIKSAHELVFTFKNKNRELPIIITELPVLPKHFYGKGNFAKDFSEKILGSGPYTLESFKMGKMTRFKRNENFWAKNHALNKGRYNFDTVVVDYFKDSVPLMESLKNGSVDFFTVYIAQMWKRSLVGPNFDSGKILKEEWKHKMNQGAYGYFFNLRNPMFQDLNVRMALTLAFDFEWTNRSFFEGSYLESASIFENSEFKASGLPNREEMRLFKELKKQFPEHIPDDVFTVPFASFGKGLNLEERLRRARILLQTAGYSNFAFNFLESKSGGARIIEPFKNNLARLGVKLNVQIKDRSVFMKKLLDRDFHMAPMLIPTSMSPGHEQLNYWHSQSATEANSMNYFGLSNKAVDILLERLVSSQTKEDLVLTARCLDRLIYHLHIMIPNWYSDRYFIAMSSKFSRPEHLPPYYFDNELIEFMWAH